MEYNDTPVAYLSYDGLTDPLGQSQIIPYLIGLSQQGYRFTIFSFEKPGRFKLAGKEMERYLDEKKIVWRPLRYTKWPPVVSTVVDVWTLWQQLGKENKKNRFQIIHCRSYITALVGLRFKTKFNAKFIFDMRGFWADERVEGGLWNLSNPLYKVIYRFFKEKEKRFLLEADHIISLTENAKQEILSWELNGSPITVIPTCVDLDLFDPAKIKNEDQEKLRAQLKIQKDDFVLLYLGSWGTWYLTQDMLEFFKELKKEKPKSKFLIVTNDKIIIGDDQLKVDVVISPAKRELVPLFISLANLAVCFIKPTFSKKASSATKVGEILAMNVPVIVNEKWGDGDFLEKLGTVTVDRFQQSGFNFKPINRSTLKSTLSLEAGVSRYQSVYQLNG